MLTCNENELTVGGTIIQKGNMMARYMLHADVKFRARRKPSRMSHSRIDERNGAKYILPRSMARAPSSCSTHKGIPVRPPNNPIPWCQQLREQNQIYTLEYTATAYLMTYHSAPGTAYSLPRPQPKFFEDIEMLRGSTDQL